MANTITDPNMGFQIPVATVDPGPDYASNVNNCLTTIGAHNHSAGNGVQITPSGLLINSDLAFNGNNATLVRSIRLSSQGSVFSNAADVLSVYSVGVDMYFRDGNGNNVRITQSGGVAGTPGSISNLSSPASAAYSTGSSTFIWQSAANTPANMDMGGIILRNIVANSHGLTITPPASLAADYAITAPPSNGTGATTFLTYNASNAMGVGPATANGLTAANMAAGISFQPGDIKMFGGPAANLQAGWIPADGADLLVATYPLLAAALFDASTGLYAWGSSGTGHFNAPMLNGVGVRGVDNGNTGNGGATFDPDSGSRGAINTNGNSGNKVGSYQPDQIVSHNHFLPGGNNPSIGGPLTIPSITAVSSNNFTSATGGNQTNMRNVYVLFAVKT